MATKNDVTGDEIKSKVSSEQYRENYDKIFRKKTRAAEIDLKAWEEAIYKDEYYDIMED